MLCRSLIKDDLLEGRKDPVVDLEHIIHEAAWKALEMPSLCGCRQKPCKRKGLKLKINWGALERRDVVESFDLIPNDVAIKPIQLYRTQFRNYSGHDQIFTFHAHRSTESSLEMTVQEGVSIGGQVNLAFGLPGSEIPGGGADGETMKAGGLLGGQVNWHHTVAESYRKTETLSWGVDSAVTLKAGERALASLSVLEAKLAGRLKIRTDAYIALRGGLPVYAVTEKDEEVVAAVDLAANSICRGQSRFEEVGTDNRSFSYTTEALVKAVYGMEQVATVRLLKPGEEEGAALEGPLMPSQTRGAQLACPTGVQIRELDPRDESHSNDCIPLVAKA